MLLGSRAAGLASFYTTALMFGPALVTMLSLTLITLCQLRGVRPYPAAMHRRTLKVFKNKGGEGNVMAA